MQFPEFVDRKHTPELGGDLFADLRLVIRPVFHNERKKLGLKYLDEKGRFQSLTWSENSDADVLTWVVGWENTPTPFDDAGRKMLLELFDEHTGLTRKGLYEGAGITPPAESDDTRKLTIRQVIETFAGDVSFFRRRPA